MLEPLFGDARRYGVPLSEAQSAQFAAYLRVLQDWQARVNLVGDAASDVVQRRHFAESLALGALLREREVLRPDARVLDVGAGAGFPGLPLRIAWPGLRLTLLEATAKKTAFLAAACEAIGCPDVTILTGRAETLGHDRALRGQFDLVLARAVAPLRSLAELMLPFARVGGRAATPKGSRVTQELTEAQTALAALGARAVTLPLPVSGAPQTVVVMIKTAATPAEYPRKDGVPRRSPL
ncbi:MAG: 16S rRNA (guanine(527)-N(7))-methyltransferase RsmG [Chloroflexi bacterium]|nr:16S rRNA (guanine(527)-N(7))-methyltransferase RsmG [Chloroflexota bacterium]